MKANGRRQTTSPTELDSDLIPRRYERIGFCFYCLEPVEARQPGGTEARHVLSGVPYQQCPQALKARGVSNEEESENVPAGRRVAS